ncbi:unnamed protein product [Porites evermanni]|uniref:Uncharacterized protein n=1 Tax=Porites evermanni TaxID=104178 RepID=A0ABN8LSX1_9CNID|nr:unnamed protein product [Porites evermanni]
MERTFHRQKILHRDYKRDADSLFQQISQRAQNVFDTNRRSDSEQPNTEQNNELSQKQKLIKNGKIVVDRNNFEDSRPWPKSLMEKVEEMLKIEEHHVISLEDMTNVEWCPKFVKPEIHGHVRGGKALPHHRCRECGRLCLHLLGRPGSKRQCLECSGKWNKKYIPVWYYHNGCKYCRRK